jgi:predicted transposase/invertase (TIGR01784 family)
MKRETPHIFDAIFKRLMELSGTAIIQFINGLFDVNHPLDSTVEYPKTENVSKKLRRLLSDIMIIIGGVHVYHIEAEIGSDATIVVRIFEYGFAEGLRTKTVSDDGRNILIRFPNARILYWETTEKTPDEVTLTLEFPEGGRYDYVVRTFRFPDHDIKELEARKMTILLPFYVLRLRKRVVAAKTTERRRELSLEMQSILEELVAAVERGARAGLMNATDSRMVLEYMEKLYVELYSGYDEFKEADAMLQERILTYSEEAELRGIEKGIEKGREEVVKKLLAGGVSPYIIARSCELPLDAVKAMIN